MSEPFDNELQNFFAEERTREDTQIEGAVTYERLEGTITDALDIHGANHVWSPDAEARSEAVRQLAERVLAENADMTIEQANDFAKSRAVGEVALIGAVISVMATKEMGLPASVEEQMKKQIQARLLVGAYDGGWVAAVNSLLAGEDLDLAKESDLELYVQASYNSSEITNPLAAAVVEIFFPDDDNPTMRGHDEVLALTFMHITRAQRDKTELPNAEAYIYEQERLGVITGQQKERLLSLLRSEQE